MGTKGPFGAAEASSRDTSRGTVYQDIRYTRGDIESSSSLSTLASAEVNNPGLEQKDAVRVVKEKVPLKSDDHDITSWLRNHHPHCKDIVKPFRDECIGRIQVFASGPPELGRDLRESVALCNDGSKVWKGNSDADVSLYWDSREY